jgi:hypothetical protein
MIALTKKISQIQLLFFNFFFNVFNILAIICRKFIHFLMMRFLKFGNLLVLILHGILRHVGSLINTSHSLEHLLHIQINLPKKHIIDFSRIFYGNIFNCGIALY